MAVSVDISEKFSVQTPIQLLTDKSTCHDIKTCLEITWGKRLQVQVAFVFHNRPCCKQTKNNSQIFYKKKEKELNFSKNEKRF